MTKGRAIQVVDDLNLRRVRQATKISSDLEYKGLKNKQQERTPAALNFVPQQQQGESDLSSYSAPQTSF